MTNDDENIKAPLLEQNEHNINKTKQKNTSFLYKIFGCCLDRASQSRTNTTGNGENQDEDFQSEQGQYHGFNPSSYNQVEGTNSQQSALHQILSFNKNQNQRMSSKQGNGFKNQNLEYREDLIGQNKNQYQNNQKNSNKQGGVQNSQQNRQRNANGQGENSKGQSNNKYNKQHPINYDSSSNFESSSGYDLSQASNFSADLRSSSLSTKTHNYDFDVSNYNLNQVFMLGKVLQLIVYIRDQKHNIDYTNGILPDDFNSDNNNNQNRQLSYNFRESYQFQTMNASARNSRFVSQYEFNPDTIKYYRRRQIYFSRFTQGIYVDPKCWPHLVPETIVQHIARRASQSNRRETIIDASCGVGQFAIAFANHINSVIAVETDLLRYNMARNNATIYNVTNWKYSQNERVSFNEGILFYSDAPFLDDKFSTSANLSDCVFLAPHLFSQNVNSFSNHDNPYYQSTQFYDELKLCLKKAFKLAPQIILLTPRNVKIVEIIESFTDAIKENLNKVKKCSIDIEKHFINDHLKYICFYFGEFGREEISSQQEFKYINQLLEKCYSINQQKVKQPHQKQSIDKKKPVRIHQQVFNELGKFQLLNIVNKFNFHFKIENMKINEDQTLLSLFYAYLISHSFMSQARISYIISRKLYTNSNISTNTNNNGAFSQIKEENDSQCRESKFQNNSNIRRVSSFAIQKCSQIKSPINMNQNTTPTRTATSNQYTEDENNFHSDNQALNNFDHYNQQNATITWDEESKSDNKSSKNTNFGEGLESAGSQRTNNITNIMDYRQTDRTLSSNSNLCRSTIYDPSNLRNTRIVYQKKKKNEGGENGVKFKRNTGRTMTDIQSRSQLNPNTNNILNDLDDKEIINNNFDQDNNNEGQEDEEKFYSETETESDYEYEDDSSFNKHNLNTSTNTNNQLSFLRKTQRVYESKLEDHSDRNRGYIDIKKSQLSNFSQQTQDQEQLIVFNFNFFEQNKNDTSFNGTNMNTSFNLLNTSKVIAQELENNQKDQQNNNIYDIIPNNLQNNNDSQASSYQKDEEFAFTVQSSHV